jgi:hypothetical protein
MDMTNLTPDQWWTCLRNMERRELFERAGRKGQSPDHWWISLSPEEQEEIRCDNARLGQTLPIKVRKEKDDG